MYGLHIRPVTFGDWGVYKTLDEYHAELVFEGTYEECVEYVNENPEEV